jgi:hypothetical protein
MLRGMAAFMHVGTELQPADYILPLYRDGQAIPAAVVDLYQSGLAPRVLLYKIPGGRLESLGLAELPHETWRKLLVARGIPTEAIVTIDTAVTSEIELGHALNRLPSNARPVRVIVVTFGPTSRLSRNALRTGVNGKGVDLRIHPVTPRYIDRTAWWRSRRAWVIYFDSYCLWLLSFIR